MRERLEFAGPVDTGLVSRFLEQHPSPESPVSVWVLVFAGEEPFCQRAPHDYLHAPSVQCVLRGYLDGSFEQRVRRLIADSQRGIRSGQRRLEAIDTLIRKRAGTYRADLALPP